MNTRFAVAVHILTFLHTQEGEPATSELIASSVGTNPALIRRLMGRLVRAGLVSAQRGSGGGTVLVRAGSDITLLDVHRAVSEGADVIPIHQTPDPRCPVGRNIRGALAVRLDGVERAMCEELARTTIAELAEDVARRPPRRRGRATKR